MKITDVALFRITGTLQETSPQRTRQAHPMDIYPEYDRGTGSGSTGPRPLSGIFVEIHTDADISGLFGPIDKPQAFVIAHDLRSFLIGRDPLATEALLDQMLRLDRHGRSGAFMTGVSPIDCALWDLKGKAWNQPVWRLLGGPTRRQVPAYASMLGFSVEPDKAARTAAQYQAHGFQAQKWFFKNGPAHGADGFAANLAMATAVRQAVGPGYKLMFDAFMGWDVAYAIKMVQALEPLDPTWMEEPIPPERVSELRRIRQAARVPIATGEHVFTRWQTKELLVNQAVDYLQNDPDWTGGISELVKICALGSAFETPVIAHGHSLLAALHVAGAQSPATVPMVEFLISYQPVKQFFQQQIYLPENGSLALPGLPGLGIVLDEDKIESREDIAF